MTIELILTDDEVDLILDSIKAAIELRSQLLPKNRNYIMNERLTNLQRSICEKCQKEPG